MRGETKVSCAVQKDGGDDPDVTTGALIYAAVSFQDGINAEDQSEHVREKEPVITIDGGSGVGRVTRPGPGSAGRKRGDQPCAERDDRKRGV